MRADKHVRCMMNDRTKHQGEWDADERMYVHSYQGRNFASKHFNDNTPFTLLPPRPGTSGNKQLYSGDSERLGLQVQGSCCTLQQRPSSGRATQRVRQQNKEEGDGRSTLLSCLNVRLENRAKPPPRTRFRTGSRPEMTPSSGALTVNHCRKAVTETHTTSCDYKNQARHGQSGAPKVSQLHLYLPSSLCEDEEQDSETQEMRISAD
ncbi:uncharacterized protein LOC125012412 isoform X1 [Mugil cephalus]|uniref:uncharacterized protein LOC125012412 isoform X1 n=1 Tax=Mugil cephalus TaxID=48193 RepID=UPI001FB80013|nr:uncharacterized protein LOC125012412 isoform X1 [Mugil cephalus]